MNSKYGRLFTERDVLTIVAGVLLEDEAKGEVGPEMAEALIAGAIESAERLGRMTFPRDEPLFLLRAQDAVAPTAVAHYAEAVRQQGAPGKFCEAARKAAAAMVGWQAEHPDRLKWPD